jgi:O-antigen/teichoic acid export membrane protein
MENREGRQEPYGRDWVRGAAVLGAAAVVSKLIGTAQKIPLQNIAGDGAFGMYSAVYPLYTFVLALAVAGFPASVSKWAAEKAAQGRHREARTVLAIACAALSAVGLLCFAALYFGADALAGGIGIRGTAPAIRSVSFAFLFVPIMSALRGYFQGMHVMTPTAVSQVAEQCVRVAVMLAALLYLTGAHASDSSIAAGAMFGSTAGAAAGLAVMAGFWFRHVRAERLSAANSAGNAVERRRAANDAEAREPVFRLFRRFAASALPIALGSVVLPLMTLVDSFTMPRLLLAKGDETAAMAQFGLYNRGLALVQLVAMVSSSVSAALVPVVAEAMAKGDMFAVRRNARRALRLTWFGGLASSVGLAVLASPLNVMLFEDNAGTPVMAILAFAAVFNVVQIVSAALLVGIGRERAMAYDMAFAAAVKVGLNLFLMPHWGIAGAAVAAIAAYGTSAALNVVRLCRAAGVRFRWKDDAGKPLVALVAMCAVLYAVTFAFGRLFAFLPADLPYRGEQTLLALTAVACGAFAYAAALLKTGAVGAEELGRLPAAGGKLLPVLRKLRIIKAEGGV